MADTQSLPVEGSVVAPVQRKAGRPKGSTNKPKAKPVEAPVKVDKRETNGGTRKQYDHTFHIPQEDLNDLQIFAPLSIKQETYLQDQSHDIVVFGGAAGAGKTQLSLLGVLLNGMYDKNYVGAIARHSQKQMKAAGSLWTTGCRMFAPYGINKNGTELTWSFPSGAEVKCHHLDDNQDDWQGTQCTEFIVDEAQQCKEDDVWYLTSRMRSKSTRRHQLRLTANPLSSSFLCDWLTRAGYLLEDGLPNPDRDGKTTWMMQQAGEFVWYSTYEECVEAHGVDDAKMALKFVFYSANVYDNPWIRKELPGYVHKLENMKTVERAKLLLGNWYAKTEGDGYVDRDWFKTVQRSEIPLGLTTIRCWDLAGTKPHEGNKNPDFTRGLKCSYDKATGMFYIHHMASMRDTSAMVETLIQQTAVNDGNECFVGIPVDPGAAGKLVADTKRARLTQNGYKCILMNTRGSKLQRAEPFLVALQDGRVCVADGVFTKEHYIELESFDGAKCSGQHDDIIDALADCWNALTGNKLIPTITIGGREQLARRQLGGSTLLR